jgi:hypothetical protein
VGQRKAPLIEAVTLLDEIIGSITSANSESSRGSTKGLLIRLRRLRRILVDELDRPRERDWSLVGILLREAVRVIVDLVISNYRCILHPLICGFRGLDRGTRVCAEILSASCPHEAERAGA